MKHNKLDRNRSLESARALPPIAAAALNQDEIAFVPSPDEVARRAYFSYVNEGSFPGHEVQHWLQAEAYLLSEHNLTRVHGFHKRT